MAGFIASEAELQAYGYGWAYNLVRSPGVSNKFEDGAYVCVCYGSCVGD